MIEILKKEKNTGGEYLKHMLPLGSVWAYFTAFGYYLLVSDLVSHRHPR